MRQGIKIVRALGAALNASSTFNTTTPDDANANTTITSVLGAELSPGPDVQTDEDIEAWLRTQGANSQFHPSSSCGMLPRAHGGVVDSKLRVYGAGACDTIS